MHIDQCLLINLNNRVFVIASPVRTFRLGSDKERIAFYIQICCYCNVIPLSSE